MKRVLLLSAYRADSHAYWAEWLQREFDEIDWRVLELPGRHFAWRIRGNPLSWLDTLPDLLAEAKPDLVLATSMVDLATIRGLHPQLADVPTVLYFHENQFAYPLSKHQVRSVEPQMVQLYAALAADRLAFNSAYNRDSFLDGVGALVARMPDHVPGELIERLADKSEVLPVGIDPVEPAEQKDPWLVLWNHRWEYDKRPDLFAAAMIELADAGVEFRLALLGPRGRRPVRALEQLRSRLADRIVADGFLPPDEYRTTVARSTVVVSTAEHEFQGLSVLEAVSAGATPVVPDHLCYSEQYPAECRYTPTEHHALGQRIKDRLSASAETQSPDVSYWHSEHLKHQWISCLMRHSGAD